MSKRGRIIDPTEMNLYAVRDLPPVFIPDLDAAGRELVDIITSAGGRLIAGPERADGLADRRRMLVRTPSGEEIRIEFQQDVGSRSWLTPEGSMRHPPGSYRGTIRDLLEPFPKENHYGGERTILPPLDRMHLHEPPSRMHLYVRYERLADIVPEARLEEFRNGYDHQASDRLDELEDQIIALGGRMRQRSRK